MRTRAALGALAALALGGCADLQTGALAGRAEAADSSAVDLPVAGRVLALDGVAGDVHVAEDPAATAAEVRYVRRARGATRASAEARLARVAVRTGGDDEITQVVWRVDGPPEAALGARVDVRVRVPPGTAVVVRLAAGTFRAEDLTGVLDAGVGGEAVVRPAPAGSVFFSTEAP